MEKYILVRGKGDSGKTTTCGLLFEELKKEAESFQLFDHKFDEIPALQYDENGALKDFIGIIILNGLLIVIISQGDFIDKLFALLEELKDILLSKGITQPIGVIVCCGKTVDKKNSAVDLLRKRAKEEDIHQFWVPEQSMDPADKLTVKKPFVAKIIGDIKGLSINEKQYSI